MRIILGVVLAFLAVVPASATWREASSEHFVIYANDSEADLRRFSEYLERYHNALAYITNSKDPVPSPSNRVEVFVVGDDSKVKELYGDKPSFVAGFYVPRAGGTRAFVPNLYGRADGKNPTLAILLHEYAHHFTISSSRFAMPLWMSEGSAEFFASASFEKDGSMGIGLPAHLRGAELYYAHEVPIRELLDEELYRANKKKGYDAFYGRAWLLYHYLTFNEARVGQLQKYWSAVNQGMKPLEAAETAFGDLDQLDNELEKYLKKGRMTAFKLGAEVTAPGPVSVRELSEGEGKMMQVQMVSQRGVTREEALELLGTARKIAESYPDDAGVLTALAEAEMDAGYLENAIAAADKAIAIDPNRKNAYVQKGKALFEIAESADDKDAAYAAAMVPFSKLNRLENDHPLPLIYYFRSFALRGEEPNETARAALQQAALGSPFDKGLWMQFVMMLADEGKVKEARRLINALVVDPHGGELARAAAYIAKQMDTAPDGNPFHPDMTGYLPEADVPDGEDGGE